MPRVSLSPKDSIETSLGVQEGKWEIVAAVVKVHQFPPSQSSGEQYDAFPCVALDFAPLDDSWERKTDSEPTTEYLGIGKLDRFHPGNMEGPEDEDPEDVGNEIGSEGNCIYAADENSRINKKSKWNMFSQSLTEKGFKADVLGRGYVPDLIGTKLEVRTEKMERGANYRGKNDPTKLVCVKIQEYPYEKKAAGKKPGKAAKKSDANGSAADTNASGNAADTSAMAVVALDAFAAKNVGKTDVERKKLQVSIQTGLMKDRVEPKVQSGIMNYIRDDEWLVEQAAEKGWTVDLESQTISFA